MYTPTAFCVRDQNLLLAAIERWNFGLLITSSVSGLNTSLIPFIVDREQHRLLAHVARANPHWRELETATQLLVSFQGPHCYISPSWYKTPDLVPTWNYVAIQVKGHATLLHEPAAVDDLMNRLVNTQEAHLPTPWTTEQVTPASLTAMKKAIVCFDIKISDISGKAKLGQNRPVVDQHSVIEQLSIADSTDERTIAALMQSGLTQ